MLQMSFFRSRRFSAANFAITLTFFALFGSVFLMTQHLQFVLGFTPLEAGIRIIPVATMIFAAPLSAKLTEKLGTKIVVFAGLVVVAAAFLQFSTLDTTDYQVVAIGLGMLGFGMGLVMAPATESIMGSVPLAKAGVGSAMNDTTREVGGALGVAVLGSVFSSAVPDRDRGGGPSVARQPGGRGQRLGRRGNRRLQARSAGPPGTRWRRRRRSLSSTA